MAHPVCMYRLGEDGRVESHVFDSDKLPSGWVDSPSALGKNAADAPVIALTDEQAGVYDEATKPKPTAKHKAKGK